MKLIFIASLILAFTSSFASAQAHRLEFYGDEALTSCDLAVTTPGLVKVHMLVTGPGNVGAISFKAPKPACMEDAVWISDNWTQPPMYAYAGNTQATVGHGVDVIFGCQPP